MNEMPCLFPLLLFSMVLWDNFAKCDFSRSMIHHALVNSLRIFLFTGVLHIDDAFEQAKPKT